MKPGPEATPAAIFGALQAPILHKLLDQSLWLSAERAIYWEEEKALIVADLHFGKTGHFRKAGIAVPQQIYQDDLQRFTALLQYFQPGQVIAVGDMFHSHMNTELDWFLRWREDFQNVAYILVRGNHDILSAKWYQRAGITLHEDLWQLPPFSFSHDTCEIPAGSFLFCGHIHPGVVLRGTGKQSLRFPCFYFEKDKAILPAFSRFTGMAPVKPKEAKKLFAIVNRELVELV